MSKGRRSLALALAIASVLALVWGMNRTANTASADRLAAACMRLSASRRDWWGEYEDTFARLFEDDLPFVREMFFELGEEPCQQLEDRMRAPFTVAAIETWQGAPWTADRLGQLQAVIQRARVRCVPLFVELFQGFEDLGARAAPRDLEHDARSVCDSMLAQLEGFGDMEREAIEPLPLTAWPEQIEAMAELLERPADESAEAFPDE